MHVNNNDNYLPSGTKIMISFTYNALHAIFYKRFLTFI